MDFSKSMEYEKYAPTIRRNMYPYYEERGVEWIEAEKHEHYRKCDLYSFGETEEVGFLMILKEQDRFYLAELHVFDELQSRGYGSQAISWILGVAAEEGFARVYVRVFKNNPAYGLYLRHGFSFDAAYPHTDQLVANTHNQSTLPFLPDR